MSLSYDQSSFVRMAFEEAYIPPLFRRRAERIKQQVELELRPWTGGGETAGDPLRTQMMDYSATGFGILHPEPMTVGQRFVLTLPRADEQPIHLTLHVVRCKLHDNFDPKRYEIGLEYDSVLDAGKNVVWGTGEPNAQQCAKKMSMRQKVIFCLFGIIGLGVGFLLLR